MDLVLCTDVSLWMTSYRRNMWGPYVYVYGYLIIVYKSFAYVGVHKWLHQNLSCFPSSIQVSSTNVQSNSADGTVATSQGRLPPHLHKSVATRNTNSWRNVKMQHRNQEDAHMHAQTYYVVSFQSTSGVETSRNRPYKYINCKFSHNSALKRLWYLYQYCIKSLRTRD